MSWPNEQKLSIYNRRLVLLIICVEYGEHLSANDHIVTIDQDHDFSGLAKVVACNINVVTVSHVFGISDDGVHGRWNLVLYHVLFGIFAISIRGSVINIDHMVIGVLLLKN